MPPGIGFENNGAVSIDERVAKFKELAAAEGLELPVLVKVQAGQKSTYAHTFFCANNENGLREALSFHGFKDK